MQSAAGTEPYYRQSGLLIFYRACLKIYIHQRVHLIKYNIYIARAYACADNADMFCTYITGMCNKFPVLRFMRYPVKEFRYFLHPVRATYRYHGCGQVFRCQVQVVYPATLIYYQFRIFYGAYYITAHYIGLFSGCKETIFYYICSKVGWPSG